jgi:hypothetical protein
MLKSQWIACFALWKGFDMQKTHINWLSIYHILAQIADFIAAFPKTTRKGCNEKSVPVVCVCGDCR